MARRPRPTVIPSRISATSTKSVITSAVKNWPTTSAATRAMVIDSSMVIRRARRFSTASLKIGYPPISVAPRPMTLKAANGSQTRSQTAAAATATNATRTRSARSTAAAGCSIAVSVTGCSFQVGLDHVDQLLRGFRLGRGGVAIGVDYMEADVALDHLGHEAVHCAPRRGDESHGGATLRFLPEGAFHGLDLYAGTPDRVEQLGLVTDEMSHGGALAGVHILYPGWYITTSTLPRSRAGNAESAPVC